jgi:hypothetical protein
MVKRLPRPLYRKALGILRSAESAVRRLIVVMARDMKVEPRPKRPAPKRPVRPGKAKNQNEGESSRQSKSSRPPSFQLCDPQKRSDADRPRRRRRRTPKVGPRVHFFGYDPRIPEFLRGPDPTPAPVMAPSKPVKDGTVSARRLCRRLFAIFGALKDMKRQAKRLARWQAQAIEDRRPPRERALRYGSPPGWRVKPTHEVHEILKECQWLFHSLPKPDTS